MLKVTRCQQRIIRSITQRWNRIKRSHQKPTRFSCPGGGAVLKEGKQVLTDFSRNPNDESEGKRWGWAAYRTHAQIQRLQGRGRKATLGLSRKPCSNSAHCVISFPTAAQIRSNLEKYFPETGTEAGPLDSIVKGPKRPWERWGPPLRRHFFYWNYFTVT